MWFSNSGPSNFLNAFQNVSNLLLSRPSSFTFSTFTHTMERPSDEEIKNWQTRLIGKYVLDPQDSPNGLSEDQVSRPPPLIL